MHSPRVNFEQFSGELFFSCFLRLHRRRLCERNNNVQEKGYRNQGEQYFRCSVGHNCVFLSALRSSLVKALNPATILSKTRTANLRAAVPDLIWNGDRVSQLYRP